MRMIMKVRVHTRCFGQSGDCVPGKLVNSPFSNLEGAMATTNRAPRARTSGTYVQATSTMSRAVTRRFRLALSHHMICGGT